MKTNYFVVNYFFTEEGAESATIDAVFNDKAEAEAYAKKKYRDDEPSNLFKVVECDEGYYHLTKLTFSDYEGVEPIFEDLGVFDCEEDACDALREEVETTNYYALNEEYMERDGEVYKDYITYGLYDCNDDDDNYVMYFVVGE